MASNAPRVPALALDTQAGDTDHDAPVDTDTVAKTPPGCPFQLQEPFAFIQHGPGPVLHTIAASWHADMQVRGMRTRQHVLACVRPRARSLCTFT